MKPFRIGNAAAEWPAESAADEKQTWTSAELAPQPSDGVPSFYYERLNCGLGGGFLMAGAPITSSRQLQEAKAAGAATLL